jgi:hypothetical protein
MMLFEVHTKKKLPNKNMKVFSLAVMTALRIVDGLRLLGLKAGLGVATGRVWCGVSFSLKFAKIFLEALSFRQ